MSARGVRLILAGLGGLALAAWLVVLAGWLGIY